MKQFYRTTKYLAHKSALLLCVVTIMLLGTSANAQLPGENDPTFNPGTGANDIVFATALQSDGKIIIGGNFTSYNGTARNRIARLNADGTLDATFDPGTGANSTVEAITLQNDGKIIIGGWFTSYNGTANEYIARLNTDGSLDAAFNPVWENANGAVKAIALQSDEKIIIGGAFTTYRLLTENYITRLNTDGTLDGTFGGTGASGGVEAIALQSDGKIIIGGSFTSYNGTARNRIARLNTDGTTDATFNPGTGANNTIGAISQQNDGKIIIGGNFTTFGGSARNRIARLNTDGTLDATFIVGTGVGLEVYSTAMQSDEKIIIGGSFPTYNGTGRNRIARLNTNGSLDATFNPGTGANNIVYATAIQSDGKIIIGGSFTTYNGTGRNRVARVIGVCINSPTVTTEPTDSAICTSNNASFSVTASNTSAYQWQEDNGGGFSDLSNGGVYSNVTTSTMNITGATAGMNTYQYRCIVSSVCSPEDTSLARTLTVNPVYSIADAPVAICDNDSALIYGIYRKATGTYYDSLISVNGCDSIHSTALSVNPTYNTPVTAVICSNDSILLQGSYQTTGGTYYDTLATVNGCDSVITTTLSVNPTYNTPVAAEICAGDSILLQGSYQTTAGTYYDTLATVNGCDSVITTTLTINPTYNTPVASSICAGDSILLQGSYQTTAGTYYDTLATVNGCDSVIATTLTVNPVYSVADAPVAICDNDSALIYGIYRKAAGTYYDSLISVNGCDSIHSAALSVNPTYNTPVAAAICANDSIFLQGSYQTTAGTYYDTLASVNSCDSVITITLTVNPTYNTPVAAEICDGDSILLQGSYQTTAGTYYDTLATVNSCDSVITTTLTVNSVYSIADAPIAICDNDSALIYGIYRKTAATYYDSLSTVNGCDSIHSTALSVNPTYNTSATAAICAGDSILLQGSYQTTAGTYYDTLATVNSCDSVITITLTVNPTYNTPVAAAICSNDSILLQGSYQTTAGTYYDTLTTVNGCDSVIATTLTVNPTYNTPVAAEICDGDSILLQGSYQTTAGTYYDTLATVNSCDSVITTTLTVNPTYNTPATVAICSGDSILLQGAYQLTAGTYYDTLATMNGCDSVITTTLTVNPVYSIADAPVAICDNDSALIYGIYRKAAGTYYDSLISVNGCDSIHSTVLSVNPTYNTPVAAAICAGDSILLQGSYQTTAGTYYDTLATVNGCDSVIATTLTINPTYNTPATAAICSGDSILLQGAYQFTAGTYYDTLATVNSCDSVITTTLTVNPVYNIADAPVAICDNDSALIYGTYRKTAGTYYDSLITVNGCDSIHSTVLNVNPTYNTPATAAICSNDSILLQGSYQTTAGTYYDTLATVNGCDSVIATTLTINPTYNTPVTAAICSGDSIFLQGSYQTTAGTFYDTLTAVNGCDSVITTTLILYPTYNTPETAAVCSGDSIFLQGAYQSTAGTYYDSLATINGCDSVIATTLTINNSSSSSQTETACDSYIWNGNTYTVSGTYTDTIPNIIGCDSVMTLNLTINNSTSSSSTIAACESYLWNGNTYTVSGTYMDTISNAAGCDSVLVLNLTINISENVSQNIGICTGNSIMVGSSVYNVPGTYIDTLISVYGCDSIITTILSVGNEIIFNQVLSICTGDSITVGTSIYTTTGTYSDTLIAAAGCDSIVNTSLSVNTSTVSSQTVTVCDSYTWNGNTYTVSGSYMDTIPNAAGCDSVLSLDLTINSSGNISQNIGICTGGSIIVGSSVYNVSGTYTDTLISIYGCDSIITTILSVSNEITFNQVLSICTGDSITVGASIYTTTGTYSDTLVAAAGCDSIVNTSLSVNTSTTSSQNVTICDSYIWNGNTYTVSGTYMDTISNAAGCDSVMTLNLTINNNSSSSQTETACNSYTWNGNTYTVSGTYMDTISNAAGCDSLMTLNLTINNSSSSSQTETVCDSYSWNSNIYTVSGTYIDTIPNAAGCDSIMTLNLTINPLPVVTLALNPDTVCINLAAYALTGGSPGGGSYSGVGVSADNFNPDTAGSGLHTITYTYTDGNGCTDNATSQIFVDVCTGISSVAGNAISIVIYPNPNSGKFKLHADKTLTGKIKIYNATGAIVYDSAIHNTDIDLSNEPAGIYFLKLLSNGRVIYKQKIIRE